MDELAAAFPPEIERWLTLAEEVASLPTAPLIEDLPHAYVRQVARDTEGLQIQEDVSGNVLVKYEQADRPPIVLIAHLDHPAWIVDLVEGSRLQIVFRGGVETRCVADRQPIRLYRPGNHHSTGEAQITALDKQSPRLGVAEAELISGTVLPGDLGIWDLPEFERTQETIGAVACDDLLAVAASLSTLTHLAVRNVNANVWGLFTRAEEVGLWGSLAAIEHGLIPPDALIISLECSKIVPHAPAGGGVVVRVGDFTSVFDPHLTHAMRLVATEIQLQDSDFRYQRRLMYLGSCEASAFLGMGYRATGLTLPVVNYHNMGESETGEPMIDLERVVINDFISEIKLLISAAEALDVEAAGDAAASRWSELTSEALRQLEENPIFRRE